MSKNPLKWRSQEMYAISKYTFLLEKWRSKEMCAILDMSKNTLSPKDDPAISDNPVPSPRRIPAPNVAFMRADQNIRD